MSVPSADQPAPVPELQAPTDLQLFLSLGLPNLPPRGRMEKMDRELHERALVMNKGFGWSRTIEPADWSDAELVHVELLSALAHRVAEGRPSAKIGLIPAAFGGSSLDDWMPGSAMYRGAVERANIAQKDGRLVGMLWYQGATKESAAQAADYARRFATMIAHLRADLAVKYVPVIVAEIRLGVNAPAVRTPLSEVPQQVIPCLFVSAEGLSAPGGRIDSATLWDFSDRVVHAWMDLAQP